MGLWIKWRSSQKHRLCSACGRLLRHLRTKSTRVWPCDVVWSQKILSWIHQTERFLFQGQDSEECEIIFLIIMLIINPYEDTPHYTPRLLWLWNHPCIKLTGFFTSFSTRNAQCANLILEIRPYLVKISCNICSYCLRKNVKLSLGV